MYSGMGWLDNDMNADEAVILEDIATLPNEISEALSGDEYDQCVQKVEKKIKKETKK